MGDEHTVLARTYLTAEEWLGLRDLAAYHGMSQSGFIRQLIKHALRAHAQNELKAALRDSAEVGPE